MASWTRRYFTALSLSAVYEILFIVIMAAKGVESIGCFVCSSFNGSNPSCEDTFNSTIVKGATVSQNNYKFPCWAFKKQRQGLFPADHCIKVNGYRTDYPAQTMVIRTCALDSGTLTADTEIVRISHCGHFKYEGRQYSGCVQACDTDGCNGALRIASPTFIVFASVMLSLAFELSSSFLCLTCLARRIASSLWRLYRT